MSDGRAPRRTGAADWRVPYREGLAAAAAGRYGQAVERLGRALKHAPGNPQVEANLGQALLFAGRPADAARQLEAARAHGADVPAGLRPLAVAFQELGRREAAEVLWRRLLGDGAGDAQVLNNLSVLLQADGRIAEAVALLEKAVASGAGVESLNNLANLQAALGRVELAETLLRRAIAADPFRLEPHQNLALLARDHGRPALAVAEARRVAVLDPGVALGVTLAAELAERRAELPAAIRLARRALAAAPGDIEAKRLLGRALRRQGDAGARRFLEDQLKRHKSEPAAYKLAFELAQACDALGDAKAAFAAFSQANATQRKTVPLSKADPSRPFAQVERIRRALALWPETEPNAPDGLPDPVFMVGFPRSGTTLLDQVLDVHPRVRVLEERPLVAGIIARLAAAGDQYPDAVPDLPPSRIAALRTAYFADRARYGSAPDGTVVVDKMPLNIVHAGLLHRVFPRARIILSLRHPCDVCLSCFMQAFDLNDWMAVFTALPDTARLYAAVFALWHETAERLGLDVHAVRYEDLTADLEATAGGVARFLGLDWDPAMASFHEHARGRALLTTPSASQVTAPLYRHAVARWRRYDFAMDPIAAMLAPEIERLGYGDGNDGRRG